LWFGSASSFGCTSYFENSEFGDIYDFKDFTKKYMKFRKEDVNGKKVNWLQIKCIRYNFNGRMVGNSME
jgi:hypothetical protein